MAIKIIIKSEYTYSGQLFDFFIGGTQRGQANLLWELSKAWIGQEWHMTEQLMNGIAVDEKKEKCKKKILKL